MKKLIEDERIRWSPSSHHYNFIHFFIIIFTKCNNNNKNNKWSLIQVVGRSNFKPIIKYITRQKWAFFFKNKLKESNKISQLFSSTCIDFSSLVSIHFKLLNFFTQSIINRLMLFFVFFLFSSFAQSDAIKRPINQFLIDGRYWIKSANICKR